MSCEDVIAADSKATGLAVTKDDMPATASTQWLYMEPNEISSLAASIDTTARDPMTKDRQRRKGTITSLSAAPQFTADTTLEMIHYFGPAALFSLWKGLQTGSYDVTTATNSSSTYTVEVGGATLVAGSLVYATGFMNAENNGLKVVGSGSTTSTVVVTDTLVDESAGSSARLYFVGVRGASGDIQIDANGDLISTILDFTTLGLYVGQFIHIGGAEAVNQLDGALNSNGETTKARIASISANKLELEARELTFTTDAGTGKLVDLYFSAFCRNVSVGDADFLKQWFHMEAEYNTDPMLYERIDCCVLNTLTLNNSLQDKSTIELGFVGKDVEAPTETEQLGVKSNQTATEAFNTTADITRLRIRNVDDEGLTSYFKDTNISINNNVAAEYVLGSLPAEFMNFGNFEVDVDTSVVFTDGMVLAAIRNNTTLGMDLAFSNNDGGFVFDMPAGTFGDGSKTFNADAKITLTTPFAAHLDNDRGYTASLSFFWYLP